MKDMVRKATQEMKNNRVLITGGAGFIGSELVRQLAEADSGLWSLTILLTEDAQSVRADGIHPNREGCIRAD